MRSSSQNRIPLDLRFIGWRVKDSTPAEMPSVIFEGAGWLERQIYTPRRVVRFLVWCLRLFRRFYLMPRGFLAVQFSRRVEPSEYIKRRDECDDCEHQVIRTNEQTRWRWRMGSFCGLCRCPYWPPARLDRKNWKRGHVCPDRRHPGPYPAYITPCNGCGSRRRATGNTDTGNTDNGNT